MYFRRIVYYTECDMALNIKSYMCLRKLFLIKFLGGRS